MVDDSEAACLLSVAAGTSVCFIYSMCCKAQEKHFSWYLYVSQSSQTVILQPLKHQDAWEIGWVLCKADKLIRPHSSKENDVFCKHWLAECVFSYCYYKSHFWRETDYPLFTSTGYKMHMEEFVSVVSWARSLNLFGGQTAELHTLSGVQVSVWGAVVLKSSANINTQDQVCVHVDHPRCGLSGYQSK